MHTSEAEARIRDHDIGSPLFLYLAYHAVHSANRPDDPLQAPSDWVDKFKYIKHEKRRIYAAMLSYLDHGVGRVTRFSNFFLHLVYSSHISITFLVTNALCFIS